jgi:hypothetical protein
LHSLNMHGFGAQFLLRLLREHPRAHNFGADVLPLVLEAAEQERRRAEEQQQQQQRRGGGGGGAGVLNEQGGGIPYRVSCVQSAGTE